GNGGDAAGAAADGVPGWQPADFHRRRRQVGEGGAELYRPADPVADHPDGGADGQPGEEPAVDVRGAVPGTEPDAAEGDPQRADQRAAVAGVPGGRPGPGRDAVVCRDPPLSPGAAGGVGLTRIAAANSKPGTGPGLRVVAATRGALPAQSAGLN